MLGADGPVAAEELTVDGDERVGVCIETKFPGYDVNVVATKRELEGVLDEETARNGRVDWSCCRLSVGRDLEIRERSSGRVEERAVVETPDPAIVSRLESASTLLPSWMCGVISNVQG